jgi:CO dehydrogenase/acetyl-CoA synthase alpha subunit
MTNVQDYLLPELSTLQASLSLDMSSRTAEKYTHYLSSLRDIIRHLPDEWSSTTRSFVSCNPYCGPSEILQQLEQERLSKPADSRELEVLESISSFARLLITVQDNVAESLRS